ncbi:sensor domain-containing diguanylate cyclase [Brenneria izbisi]|uniref:diguanylate cyclase n=1 Tax=Brenneria izbisi TaxID=2939450 RepID=A0AA41XWS8_9GAMM|nr:sensor domain-containing diguanylate cyclase [Brenneria izbisi]MCV9878370.1 sensor domain-containing diguanylate cyclase [Brenneria izbisi]MCV9881793.1 sensor domain-containing diguanylate cyclase [Brenneria izbisi]
MLFKFFNNFGLRRLIILLAIMSALVTLANSFYASYRVQRQLLVDNTLEANRVYATKLASLTAIFFKSSLQQLTYSASRVSSQMDDSESLSKEVDRIQLQTNSFNSVAIVDTQGVIKAITPDTSQLIEKKVSTHGSLEALQKKQPLISQPYISSANNFIVLISAPIFTRDGRYKGFIAGSIYLKMPNILSALLDEHYYRDGSYIYVTGQDGQILYHKDANRIGKMGLNPLKLNINQSHGENNGSGQTVNLMGKKMLAGYAFDPTSQWTIIALRPTAATLKPLDSLMLNVLRYTLPLAVLTILCVWVLAWLIAKPLWLLARSANKMDALNVSDDIRKIHSWYFEATQLKQAMLLGIDLLQRKIGRLRTEAHSDPMTGLLNRRGLENVLRYWLLGQKNFSIISLDIDYFKRINDTHGHDVGDEVINALAQLIRAASREADILCRNGGEEFLILLPETPLEVAINIAERLRQRVQETSIPIVGNITISLGVAQWSPKVNATTIEQAFKKADQALYEAKQGGRNRVVAAPDKA